MARKFAVGVFDAIVVMGNRLRRAIPATVAGARDSWKALAVSPGHVQAFVAVLTLWILWNQWGINARVAEIQEQQGRLASVPELDLSFAWRDTLDNPLAPFFIIQNEGGDSAFGIWPTMQNLLVLDTVLIYDRYRPDSHFSVLADHSGVLGMFTRDAARTLAPSSEQGFVADIHDARIGSVSAILGGVQMAEVTCIYWDGYPQRRYEKTEYFIIDDTGPTASHLRVSDMREGQYWLNKINDLKSRNAIAEMDQVWRENFYGTPLPSDWGEFKTLISVLCAKAYTSYQGYRVQYNSWRDTLVVFDSTLVPIDSVRSILLHRARN